jgi:hypothetical protein
MKRLVDESTDELTRSLLVAGIEHRPAPGNKARVIVALGAGGGLGLFSSNAFAWLGTTAGKVTAAGVAVGVAGAVFIAAPRLRDESARIAQRSSVATNVQGVGSGQPALDGSPSAPQAAAGGALAEGVEPSVASAAEGSHVSGIPASEGPVVASGKTATKKLSAWRERRLAARRKAALARQTEGAGAEPALADPAPAPSTATALDPRVADPPGLAGHGVDLLQKKADLDSEVQLVDEMHWAARHNDHQALGRFLERYRETFPDGQLKKEVAEFAARLERSEASRSR